MSCAGKGYGTNPSSDGYLHAQFSSMISSNSTKSTRKCRKFNGFYPNFAPILYNLSVTFSSTAGAFVVVYVTGANFLPNGSTYIHFGDFANVQPVFYSSYNLSFVVPLNAPPGVYNVQAVNVYNGNFSPSVNQSYGANLNYSNSLEFDILGPPSPPPVQYLSVAVGMGSTGNIAYSLDGLNWSSTKSTVFTQGLCVQWNGSLWVAGGLTGFAYSTDGIYWSVGNGPSGFVPYGLGFNGSLWMAAGTDNAGTTMCYSVDGITWLALLPIAGASVLYDIHYNGTMWVAVGGDGVSESIFYSYGGVWTPANSLNMVLYSVAWNGVLWVAAGIYSVGALTYSTDGINWSLANSSPLLSVLNTVAWSGTMWVATGASSTTGGTFAYSYDGVNWTVPNTNYTFAEGYGVVWAATRWIAVGTSISNTIAYSYDGQNWYGLGNNALTDNGYQVASTYVPSLLTPLPAMYYWSLQSNILCAGYTVVAPQVYTTSVLPTSLTPAPSIAWNLSGNMLSTTWNITVLALTINPTTSSTPSPTNNYWYIDTSTPNTIYTTYPLQVQSWNTIVA